MNHARPGSCDDVSIYIDSSGFSLEDELSTLNFQTAGNAVHGIDKQEDSEHVEDVVNSYSNATMTFKNAVDNGHCGETVPIKTIKVPYAGNLASYKDSAPGASPKSSTGIHGRKKPDEPLGFEVQGDDARLPEQASTGGLRHSSRKRNQTFRAAEILFGKKEQYPTEDACLVKETGRKHLTAPLYGICEFVCPAKQDFSALQVCYHEGSRSRSAPERPCEGRSIKKKFTCLRIRASNFLSDEDEESER